MRVTVMFLLVTIVLEAHAQQPKVLHYTETSGFDHGTRTVSLSMFQTIGATYGFTVDDDQTGDAFNVLGVLSQYDVVIFSNTSSDAILDATQRANFESYISNGGSYLGIHAATDTYRHSSANGSNTGTWDFYAELVGASVQQNPNHVAGTPEYEMTHLGQHASVQNLPDPWVKNEEYYYWEGGFFGNDNTAVLQVEETVGPNNMVNSYDAARPMSWYRNLNSGGRMFYTALGHAQSNFTSDADFIQHITDALLWVLGLPVGIMDEQPQLTIRTDVLTGTVSVHMPEVHSKIIVQVVDALGRPVQSCIFRNTGSIRLELPRSNTIHLLRIMTDDGTVYTTRILAR